MATFRRRGKKWRVEICCRGKRLSKTFNTKVECEHWANITLYELQNNQIHPTARKTLREALERYLNECTHKKRGAIRESKFIHRMMMYEICDNLLENVTTAHWAEWRDQRLTNVSPATVRREITIIKAMYKVAISEWLWLRVSPVANLKLPSPPPPRDRRVYPEEQHKMLEAFDFTVLRTPKKIKEYVACAWLFALETAMRSGEILNLQWQHVHLEQLYVHIPTSKNGSKRDVPLSKRAIEILKILPHDNYFCFNINGRQRDANFRKYRKLAGIDNMTFHDSRHEALTRLAQKLHILNLARMAGMKDTKTLMIYYNATASEIAKKLD
ncbi:MAG: site-specific integrase [Cardiobacteriaceae bacterium]|nr:site-specific integrase [Cardiobacteriaceae bacterium]